MIQAPLQLQPHNPDVLMCIANLSNDEVFTPPELVNQMLDALESSWADVNNGANIWENKDVTFLDPCTKSGVFLREIVKRLTVGLESKFPDLTERVNHILTKQVFGIAITELTSLLARRSLYCSKFANGIHSVARVFKTEEGNVWFERTEHTWEGGKCRFCGASKAEYARSKHLENHAYAFIHAGNLKEQISKMFGGRVQFDVIIGNPPYQLSDGGGEGASAVPLYHKFVTQAKSLEPEHLIMVIPARWYSGGKGLDVFRDSMLSDERITAIHDFAETDLVFPGVNIRGGVCYFLRSKNHSGPVKVTNHRRNQEPISALRPLREPGIETFVRYNEAISILQKVRAKGEPTFSSRVQARNPFGIPSDFVAYSQSKTSAASIRLFRSRRGSSANKEVFVQRNFVEKNHEWIDKIKVLVSKASPGGDEYPHAVFSTPLVAPRNSVCTETYLIVDFAKNKTEAENLITYMETQFFRFLVSLVKNTQNISKGCFEFVPILDMSKVWTDEDLYKRYGITYSEAEFINTMIRPVVSVDE